ncbi:MAG: 5-oxoprolinase [Betaproteobacteria bacterium RIFCSPLOWO2_12_FULL_65_14]|nr:MAG: 5-oxoprolinase [Betaproteobacteria bacterium RIFCSPLOWO2_12_FULL_65_14]
MSTSLRIAADIGGTFTDVAAFDERSGELLLGKTLSTPGRLVDGITQGVAKAGTRLADARLFLHGSTIAINTMLERSGAKVALVTTQGFRDIYEIGRVNRPDSFNLRFRKHEPLVERALRLEVKERLMHDGTVREPLDMSSLEAAAERIEKEDNVEAIAVLFLHSYRNPEHELAAKRFLEKKFPAAFVTVSSELSQEYREFERTSTVVANAYIGPRVHRYLEEIDAEARRAGFSGKFMLVQSTGGLYSLREAKQDCVRMMESGPAAGVIGTQAMCEIMGIRNAIAFDMGGTTAKAGVVRDGLALTSGSTMIGGYFTGLPLLTPMIDIHEVGTGGGSIARVSATGGLRVGPQSAGAAPGPACYGLGGDEPTVTDANLLLGRLAEDRFLGGEMRLDKRAAAEAMRARIGEPLGMTEVEAASGILRIATASMSHAVKGVTTDRGLDPGEFPTLFAYGGAGPLHASMVARELRIPQVVIPAAPGHFSAFGMLLSDFRRDLVQSRFVRLDQVELDDLRRWFAELEAQGSAAVKDARLDTRRLVLARALDMRYVGQEHAVTVDVPLSAFSQKSKSSIKRHFDELHEERYGRGSPEEPAEIVSIRSTVTGLMKKPRLARIARGTSKVAAHAATGERRVFFPGKGWTKCRTYRRDALKAGNRIAGPALVEEHASTTVLEPGDALRVDRYGNLVIAIGLS